ncbi:NAD(P)-dependent oxidoreductase [Rhizobium sp. TRM95111]|uniref:NAD-dependent epimerase/dehydratase family protein n=1 Tax=Rhizobium alarense TaxID=2846851 RepID=UPI001F160DE9|nr:NAD(P)-dependent oxidoreductase [Rhizobium alarense]MCF3638394.1 NAD(P)-dependent oxidoreductase [Rhizobium alarense]
MTRVLVSGGTGYVGRFVVEHLLARGYRVAVGGRTPPFDGFFSAPVSFVPLRLDPEADQIDAFENVYYFVHAAFAHAPGRYRGGEGDDPDGFRRANLGGSVRLFEAARDAGVRRCVFLSSRAAYGSRVPGGALTEEMMPRPDTLYGRVKLDTERSLQALCSHAFVTASLRVTGVYGPAGPGRRDKWADMIEGYLAGESTTPRAGTEVHGDDVAAAVRLMLETDSLRVNGETFNVSDILTDRHEILSIVRAATHCPHDLPPEADRASLEAMSTDKLAALGWIPGGTTRLRETVKAMAQAAAGSRTRRQSADTP